MRAHFPESEETQKGHMQNERQGLRSTRKLAKRKNDVDGDNASSTECLPIINNLKHQDVFMCTFDLKNEMQSKIYDQMKEKIYSDQRGKCPVRSSRSHQYIMVLINMDSSYISMEPMKTRHASQIVKTYQIMIDRLKACGINPKKHVLNNECSEEFKEAIRAKKLRMSWSRLMITGETLQKERFKLPRATSYQCYVATILISQWR